MDKVRIAAKIALLKAFQAKGHSAPTSQPDRLPPGQHLTKEFPVLDLGIRPDINLSTWTLTVDGLVPSPLSLSLESLKALGVQHYTKDFHCVTTWSKFDVMWTGIPMRNILANINPDPAWKFLIQHGADGYSTNVPRADVERDDVFLAFELEGNPIPREHGFIRLIIPHLYAWKASKFLTRFEFSAKDKPGFWEVRGYHNHGDAFKEERYS